MRFSVVSTLAVLALPLTSLGCGDDTSSSSDSDTEGSTGTDSSSTSVGTSAGTSTATTGGTTTGTTDGTTTTDGSTGDPTTTDGTTGGTTGGSTGGSTGGAALPCGNGVLDADEVCDDGNIYDGDGCSADCSAANCLVPVSHATIQAGIDDLTCSTVWVMPGTYTENVTIDRFVIVEGIPLGDVTVDGNSGGSVFNIDAPSVVLRNLIVTNGMATRGGGIRAAGSLTLERTTVTLNTATGAGAGGAGVSSNGMVTLLQSSIVDNTLTGGPLSLRTGAGLEMRGGVAFITAGSTISDNTLSMSGSDSMAGLGGGIYANNATVVLDGGSVVDGNEVNLQSSGGTGNVAVGGGIAMAGGDLTVTNATVSANDIVLSIANNGTGVAHGGGIAAGNGISILAAGAVVDANTITTDGFDVSARGGGVFVESNELFEASQGATVSSNTLQATGSESAVAAGGGAFQDATADMRFVGAVVDGNTATANTGGVATAFARGGGIALHQGEDGVRISVDSSTISGNQATGNDQSQGGGVSVFTTSPGLAVVAAINSTITGNVSDAVTAASGGGLSMEAASGTGQLEMYNCTITENVSTLGGGVHVLDSGGNEEALLTHSILYDNAATTGPNCAPALTATFENLLGPVTGCTIDTTDAVTTDPSLGTLGDNGGFSPTQAIDNASSAFNAGQTTCEGPMSLLIDVDQRGLPRAGNCTLGAYEPQP